MIIRVAIAYAAHFPASDCSNRPLRFLMSNQAFLTETEARTTVLHEMYALHLDLITKYGYSSQVGNLETDLAFSFSKRALRGSDSGRA